MNILRRFASGNYWKKEFFQSRAPAALLEALGVLWVLLEIFEFLFPDLKTYTATHIPQVRWTFLGLCVLFALWKAWPRSSLIRRLNGRDVQIEIRIGDMFSLPGAFIIPTNTTFDTLVSPDIISERSVQGQFTKQFYDSIAHLDADIAAKFTNDAYTGEQDPAKTFGKKTRYPIGTVIKITPKQRPAYLVATAEFNTHPTVRNGKLSDVMDSLGKLWAYISDKGGREELIIPLFGTGFSRVPVQRKEIVQEIIKSFVAACATKVFTEKLTIAIHPADYQTHELDLIDLERYLDYVCAYTHFKSSEDRGVGTSI